MIAIGDLASECAGGCLAENGSGKSTDTAVELHSGIGHRSSCTAVHEKVVVSRRGETAKGEQNGWCSHQRTVETVFFDEIST